MEYQINLDLDEIRTLRQLITIVSTNIESTINLTSHPENEMVRQLRLDRLNSVMDKLNSV